MIKTKEEIEALNKQQKDGRYHPYTCCSYKNCNRSEQIDSGTLIATEECWVCPCGKYKQEYRGNM